MPFGHAVRELAAFAHVHVHASTARRTTEAAGATMVALQTQEAAHILATHPAATVAPDRIVASVDGAMVPLVHGVWAEVRTLALGIPAVTTTADGTREIATTDLSYFSRLATSRAFADLATCELQRRGVFQARQVGAVVDGADWCQTFLDLHVPEAVRILDFPHAAEYVAALGETTSTTGERLRSAAAVETLLHTLKHDGAAPALAELGTWMETAADPVAVGKLFAYLEKRAPQMAYPTFHAAGWPLGSGIVESANKLVVEARLKGAGMHWDAAQVNPMLALRNLIANDRWEEGWRLVEQEQRQVIIRARAERSQEHRRAAIATMETTTATLEPKGCLPPASIAQVQAELAEEKKVHPWRQGWAVRQTAKLASAA